MSFVAQNQHADLPQRVFEVGDVVSPDEKAETRVEQTPSVCGVVTDVKVNLTEMMKDVVFLLTNLGLEGKFGFTEREDPTFIKGRTGDIVVNGRKVGLFGELSPEVLARFEISNPAVGFEVKLPRSGLWEG